MFDGDPQARVKDRDRDRAVYVIDAALRNRQITQADRDLRVERARAAATVGELEALVRDVATPPLTPLTLPSTAVVAPSPPVATPPVTAAPGSPTGSVPADLYGPGPTVTTPTPGRPVMSGTAKKWRLGCLGVLLAFFVLPTVAGVLAFSLGGVQSDEVATTEPDPVGPPFTLDASGVRDFVAAYEAQFGTTEVVRAVFYDGYVVTWVPQGDGQVALYTYTDGAFSGLGDPMDGTDETAPVDLADLRPPKVMRLVRIARSTLNVADPQTTYVIVDRSIINGEPEISVYVENEAGDAGYLFGDFDGNVTYTQADD